VPFSNAICGVPSSAPEGHVGVMPLPSNTDRTRMTLPDAHDGTEALCVVTAAVSVETVGRDGRASRRLRGTGHEQHEQGDQAYNIEPMRRHDFLAGLHAVYQPRTYFEIGVQTGGSLTLSRAPTVAVDPAPRVSAEIRCNLHLARTTSDDFFARPAPLEHFGGLPVDLAFIDGMHLFEYALRDFINTERHTTPTSVIVFDDVLPRTPWQARRRRWWGRGAWAGDVYRVMLALQRHRPDLVIVPVDTSPTGTLVVLGLDPTNTVLADSYHSVVADCLRAGLPTSVLDRSCAVAPDTLLRAPLWDALRSHRERGHGHADYLRSEAWSWCADAIIPRRS
jgi:hypothetical protein